MPCWPPRHAQALCAPGTQAMPVPPAPAVPALPAVPPSPGPQPATAALTTAKTSPVVRIQAMMEEHHSGPALSMGAAAQPRTEFGPRNDSGLVDGLAGVDDLRLRRGDAVLALALQGVLRALPHGRDHEARVLLRRRVREELALAARELLL